jgi:hypothetical protein
MVEGVSLVNHPSPILPVAEIVHPTANLRITHRVHARLSFARFTS